MKGLIMLVLLGNLFADTLANDGAYAVSKIPPELLVNANVVVRKSEKLIELRSLEKMVTRTKFVITVLNEGGDRYAYLVHPYDKFTTISFMEGNLYDVAGRKIKSMKKGDIEDESGTGSNLADDNRYKYHSFHHRVYPYTVEYESELTSKETMFFPFWDPMIGENISLELASMRVIVPANYVLRYKAYNCQMPVVADIQDSRKEFTWNLKNLLPIKKEPASPAWSALVPFVMMAPSEFQIEDYRGDMKDWKEYGRFVNSLKTGRDVLPENIKQQVHRLTDLLTSRTEKINVLYTFLQNNTRYISIQLGIGGWRPFEASFVASKAYGDCKALSNYMVALLKEAGVPAYYTLVKAGEGERDIILDFPSSQYNHVIVCVPNTKDSIWLECTSQTEVPGYMGKFTGNRHALLITDDGGKMVTTPHYGVKENLRIRKVTASINSEGQMTAVSNTLYQAMPRDRIHGMINGLSKDKLTEYLKERMDLPNFDVKAFAYREDRALLPSIHESLEIVANHYAAISGKRIFISPNLLSKTHNKPELADDRKFDVELNEAGTSIDSIEISIPTGYEPESIPKDVAIQTKFGTYSASVKVSNDKVIYHRKMEEFSGKFPAAEYNDLVKFWNQLYKADRNMVVLVRKSSE